VQKEDTEGRAGGANHGSHGRGLLALDGKADYFFQVGITGQMMVG